MSVARKLGIMVFFAVPAIIGGGFVYHFTHDYSLMFIFQFILLLIAGAFVAR